MANTTSKNNTSNQDLVIIAIGASAGGLDALYKLLADLPSPLDNAVIIIAQHLSPTHKSHLVSLLAKKTKLNVEPVQNELQLKSDTVYVTPQDREVSYKDDKLFLVKEQDETSTKPKPSIDYLFSSLAKNKQNNIIGVLLSGSSRDGISGMQAIKQAGGYTIAQEPQTAEYDIMPLAAIDSGHVDYVLPPDEMGKEIRDLVGELRSLDRDLLKSFNRSEIQNEILGLLFKRTETNFENYKPTTIFRRLHKRLNEIKINNLQEYLEFIKNNPREIDALFETILIGVTDFFRDKESFELLEKHLKKKIKGKVLGDSIRIWVPGCATGEEPYSIAILINQILKGRIDNYNLQIFATDIDEKALSIARKGIYPKNSLKNMGSDLVDKYFLKKGNNYTISKTIRSSILFSKHDIAVNPPFLKLDLISCRNLFIYFNTNLQKQILPIFHYALNKDGLLFLGKAETIGSFTDLFAVVDAKNKLYQRKRGNNINALRFGNFKTQRFGELRNPDGDNGTSISGVVKETLYKTYPFPYVVINDSMDILEIRGDVHHFLGLREGNMDTNIFRMAHESLQLELRNIISKASSGNALVSSKYRKVSTGDNTFLVRVTAQPMVDGDYRSELFLVAFEKKMPEANDIHQTHISDDENSRLIELEQELSATKENMQRYIEVLETSNEEMQSLNEEMQSTYEELHTSNEELESTNEELQSSYDEVQIGYAELQEANDKLAKKEVELRKSEANTWALLNNTLQSFVLIDRQYKIITYNKKARESYQELIGKELKEDKSFIDFITAKNTEPFRNDLDKVFNGETVGGIQTVQDITGKFNWLRYHYSPVINKKGVVEGVSCSTLDITAEKEAQRDLLKSEQLNELFFESPSVGIILTDETGDIYRVNDKYCEMSGFKREELLGKPFTVNVMPPERKKALLNYHKFTQGVEVKEETEFYTKNREVIDVMMTGILLTDPENKHFKLTTIRDISDQKRYEVQLKQSLKEKEFMLQEIHHRVKNNMAVITGLLSLQADNINDDKIKRLYHESENRIRSIAMIHEKLYQSKDFSAIAMDSYIEDLTEMIDALIQPDADIKVNIKAEKVYLNINSAVPCGLIIHELISNAYEHAFKGKEGGKISVNFTHHDNLYSLIIEDDGIGMPKENQTKKVKSLGLNLIQGLAKQLNADFSISRDNGTKFTIEFKDQ
ncbi:MAG: CheR family methyltransferase [Balneolales bacterium]